MLYTTFQMAQKSVIFKWGNVRGILRYSTEFGIAMGPTYDKVVENRPMLSSAKMQSKE